LGFIGDRSNPLGLGSIDPFLWPIGSKFGGEVSCAP
jgi:hypothetical protein